jgi:ABC-type Mn2+/Zn2+ transport system ATPase subunit
MQLNITISDVQHINSFNIDIDATGHGLKCIVGKNGVGKTTLIKCIRNFLSSDTFVQTSSDDIFCESSEIKYCLGSETYSYNYDSRSRGLEMKKPIPSSVRDSIDVELPIPHGSRFNFFQSISRSNEAIVKAIALQKFNKPVELIELLNNTYSTNKFDNLIEVKEKGESYYCLLVGDKGRYIREDYLSSGEFFLISLYRKVRSKKKLIVIDELDISLDAAAQVFLIKKLREYCADYLVNIIFTTHSLALMRTLYDDELHYLTNETGNLKLKSVSYNYIKSILFGFDGWDKYILTEDEVLQKYIEHLIGIYCKDTFYRYKIIYVGGGSNTVDLMQRNRTHEFLSSQDNVICILDGDQKEYKPVTSNKDSVFCIPQESVEKDLFESYKNKDLDSKLTEGIEQYIKGKDEDKKLYSNLIRHHKMSESQIHDFVTSKHKENVNDFSKVLTNFLCR